MSLQKIFKILLNTIYFLFCITFYLFGDNANIFIIFLILLFIIYFSKYIFLNTKFVFIFILFCWFISTLTLIIQLVFFSPLLFIFLKISYINYKEKKLTSNSSDFDFFGSEK